jgi:MFS family permease
MIAVPANTGSWYERNWRWFVLATLFLATFLNYFDRQTLGTAMDPIARELGLDHARRGTLLAAFIYAYAASHLFIGPVVDRVRNVRHFFPFMLAGWSASTLLVGWARHDSQILWLRILLGIWESVNFPLCLLIIRRIFPPEERSLASGIFASGAFLATLAAPPMVIFLSSSFNWRFSFVIAGLLGLLWLIPWYAVFQKPETRSAGWAEAMAERKAAPVSALAAENYGAVLRAPGFWVVALMGLGLIPSLYFATQWFPSYFTQALGHPYNQALAYRLSVIYLMQDAGLWVGGALVLWLSRRGIPILKSRKLVIGLAYLLMLMIVPASRTACHNVRMLLFCCFTCGIGAFLGNQHAFKQDVDRSRVGTVAALVGAIETGFTAFVVQRIGVVLRDTADFTPAFLALGGLATFAFAVAVFLVQPRWFKIE